MSQARAWSVALVGMQATMVEVETAIGSGLPSTTMVGLPDLALSEAKARCRAAMAAAHQGWPSNPVTINLSPAALPKAGSHYDLSICAAVAAAGQRCSRDALDQLVLFGEVGLDGRVRSVRGLLPALLGAVRHGFVKAVVPAGQLGEANLVDGLAVFGVASLADLFDVLEGGPGVAPEGAVAAVTPQSTKLDLADVAGQGEAKWALEVAAAGRHHLYLHGPPGVGKTLLAERLPTLLPDLAADEALEVSAIHSLLGLELESGLIRRPPFADPHHTASIASLVGGGARVAQPGAVSRAHHGVLFLDEAPEFPPKALEALRVPLESGRVVLSRANATATYPAQFQLVLAANPCPCGNAATPGAQCLCPPMAVRRYRTRVSGPILDRIDIHQQLRPVRLNLLSEAAPGEPSQVVAARVAEARQRQARRLAPLGLRTNGQVPGPVLRRRLPSPSGAELLSTVVQRGQLSARGVDKVVRLAWTIADLEGLERPGRSQLQLALAMRRGEPTEAGAA
jgi:Mg chelatase-related protein